MITAQCRQHPRIQSKQVCTNNQSWAPHHHSCSEKVGAASNRSRPTRPSGTMIIVTTGTTTRLVATPTRLVSPNQNRVIGAIRAIILICVAINGRMPNDCQGIQTNNQVAPALSQKLAPSIIRGSQSSIALITSNNPCRPVVFQPNNWGSCAATSIR